MEKQIISLLATYYGLNETEAAILRRLLGMDKEKRERLIQFAHLLLSGEIKPTEAATMDDKVNAFEKDMILQKKSGGRVCWFDFYRFDPEWKEHTKGI